MKRDSPYGFEDFRRYHTGDMSPKEQHLFERGMLEDPFLRDAYEGYQLMLRDGVKPGHWQGKPSPVLPVRKTSVRRIWRYTVAASVFLVIGLLFFQRWIFRSQEEDLAYLPDTMHLKVEVMPSLSVSEPTVVKEEVSPVTIRRSAPVKADKKVRIKVADEGGRPIPGVFVSKSGKIVGFTNSDGAIEMDTAGDQMVEFLAVGLLPEKILIKHSQQVTMRQDTAKLNEVVVVGYGTNRGDNAGESILTGAALVVPSERFSNPDQLDQALNREWVQRKKSDERLASSFGSQSGEMIMIRATPPTDSKVVLFSGEIAAGHGGVTKRDTNKVKTIYLPDADRKNWEELIRKASRNSLMYGEGVRFSIISFKDSVSRDFTPGEMDELRDILRKMTEKDKAEKENKE